MLSDIDKLKKALEKLKDEPKINAISGYIGERLIYEWLNFNNPNGVSHDNQADYDLRLNYRNQSYFIEVKTTTGSAHEKDATSKIFFRPAQQDTAENNRRENYFLVQIGLKDLGLFDFYKEFRDEKLEDVKEEINTELSTNWNSMFFIINVL